MQNQFKQSISDVALDVRTAVRDLETIDRDVELKQRSLEKANEELQVIQTRYELMIDKKKASVSTSKIYCFRKTDSLLPSNRSWRAKPLAR